MAHPFVYLVLKLINRCEHVLIREHSEIMWEEFQKLLDYDKDEDLQRMYALLARIHEGLEPLRKKFEEHVKQAGLVAVSKLVGDGGAAVDTLVGNVLSRMVLPANLHVGSESLRRCFA